MKKSGFKPKTLEEVKKKQAQKLASLKEKAAKRVKVPKGNKKRLERKNKPTKTISTPIPKWIQAIPENKSHGSGTYQKRLWKLTSDYVRIRDFYKYGRCVATGEHFSEWKGANVQAGHLKNYATCNGLYKFDVRNIHAQSSRSNRFPTYDDHINFRKEVARRGYDWDLFEKESNANNGARIYDSEVIEQIEKVLISMKDLPEQPDYYERAINLLEEYKNLCK